MKEIYLDCRNGATKEMLCSMLYRMLDEEDRHRVIAYMCAISDYDINVSVDPDGSIELAHPGFAITIDDMTEVEHKVAHRHGHDHGKHGHSHEHHRGMKEIGKIVDAMNELNDGVKRDIMGVYGIIAEAEAKVHGSTPDEVHFHEVGGMYAIATVTAACIMMDMIGADKVTSSPVRVGKGEIECAHGILPVPAPATAAIIGDEIPTFPGDEDGEFCTPTSAAILRYFVDEFKEMI